jgi:hypothetical protein
MTARSCWLFKVTFDEYACGATIKYGSGEPVVYVCLADLKALIGQSSRGYSKDDPFVEKINTKIGYRCAMKYENALIQYEQYKKDKILLPLEEMIKFRDAKKVLTGRPIYENLLKCSDITPQVAGGDIVEPTAKKAKTSKDTFEILAEEAMGKGMFLSCRNRGDCIAKFCGYCGDTRKYDHMFCQKCGGKY